MLLYCSCIWIVIRDPCYEEREELNGMSIENTTREVLVALEFG